MLVSLDSDYMCKVLRRGLVKACFRCLTRPQYVKSKGIELQHLELQAYWLTERVMSCICRKRPFEAGLHEFGTQNVVTAGYTKLLFL
jgi:hypothetical protein